MRKLLCILSALLLLLSSCAAPAASDSELDNALYMASNLNRNVAAAEDGFFFTQDRYVYYVPYDTMEPRALCAKPNCLHDAETDEQRKALCNARLDSVQTAECLFYDGGALYTLTAETDGGQITRVLTRISADGAERKTVYRFDRQPQQEEFGGGTYMALHRGYCYWSGTQLDAKQQAESGLWRVALDGKRQAEYLGEPVWDGCTLTPLHLRAVGERLFFLSPLASTGEPMVPFSFDPAARSTARLFDTGRPVSAGSCIPWNGGLFCAMIPLDERDPENPLSFAAHGYTASADGGDVQELPGSFNGDYIADDRYLYVLLPAALAAMQPDAVPLRILDAGGERLRCDLAAEVPGYRSLCVLRDAVLILYEDAGGPGICWFAKSDIETGSLRILPLTR